MRFEKNLVVKAFLGFLVLVIFTIPNFGLMWVNDTESAYEEPERNVGTTIGSNVVDGAGSFLNGYSHILLFLNKIELSGKQGIDYAEVSNILDKAIDNMEGVKASYVILIQKAKTTPYNTLMIQNLKEFDYNGLLKRKGLNRIIFSDVEFFLSDGNVLGVYAKILSDMEGIINLLYRIKETVDAKIFPGMSNLWELNDSCSRALLFGQYVAMVFGDILR